MRCIAETAKPPNSGGTVMGLSDSYFLRNFHPMDVPRIADIVADALREHYEPSLYISLSREWPEGYLVAVDGAGMVQGFLLGVNQTPSEGRILMFAVDAVWRRRSVGSSLMSTFFHRCRMRGLRRVTLEVRVGNDTAIRFYQRYGYTITDLFQGYYSDGENGYQMARYL